MTFILDITIWQKDKVLSIGHNIFSKYISLCSTFCICINLKHLHILPGRIASIYSLGVVISDVVLLSFTSFTCKVRKMQWIFLEVYYLFGHSSSDLAKILIYLKSFICHLFFVSYMVYPIRYDFKKETLAHLA